MHQHQVNWQRHNSVIKYLASKLFIKTLVISVHDLKSVDPILITKVNRPPSPVGHVTLLRVSAHPARSTVFLYPVHCLV